MSDIIRIQLSVEHSTIVDPDTFKRLQLDVGTWKPQVHKKARKVYAVSGGRVPEYLHRLIMGAQKGQIVDHINGNSLDNRKCNLRFATAKQNSVNSKARKNNLSGHKGVSWNVACRKWMAIIMNSGKRYYLGVFTHKDRAAMAYDRAALFLHGEFAGLNFEDKRASYRPTDPAKKRPDVRRYTPAL